jgi:hypothetical protein
MDGRQKAKDKIRKPCAKCEYHDWEWDEFIGFRDICKGIGICPYNVEIYFEKNERWEDE